MTKQAKPMIGALVSDGGRGVYPADIIEVGDCFIVAANPDWGGIQYEPLALKPTHEVVEVPGRIYTSRTRGVIVVPKKQLVVL